MKKLVIGIVVIILLAGGSFAAFGRGETGKAALGTPTVAPAVKSGDKVVTDARVVPVQSAELSLSVGGTVAEVPVAEGDKVKPGQLLVRLDAKQQAMAVTQAEAGLARAKAGLARAKATLAQLKAGPRDEDLAAALAALHIAQAEMARTEKGADKGQLVAAQVNMEKAARSVQQAQTVYDQISYIAELAARPEAVALEHATLDYEAAKAQYQQLKAGATEADLNVSRARVEQAQAALAQAEAGARAEAVAAAEADVSAADADVATAEAGLAKARAVLADAELRAPFGGAVASLSAKVGEQVAPSTIIVRLADNSDWEIETQDLTELSVVKLRKGAPVSVTFDAIPDLKLPGTISRIGEFGKNKQGDIVYTVVVKPDKNDERLRWNMTASVVIESK